MSATLGTRPVGSASACGLITGAAPGGGRQQPPRPPESTPGQPGRPAARGPCRATLISAVKKAGQAGATSVFGFMSRRDPATGAISVTRLIDLIRACGLLVVIVTVSLASPGPGSDGALGVAIAVMLGLSAVAWVAWMLSGSTGDRHWLSVGEPDRDGRGGRRARRAVAEQPGRRRRLRGHLQRGRPAADRGVAGHHGRDNSRVPDHGAGHRGPGRRAPGLHVRLRRPVERGPDPARVPGPGRTSRAHARRDPARPRGGNPRRRTGRAGQDRPGHPRRAGPLAGRGVGQPAGRRGLADGGIAPRGQPGAGQGGRVHRPGRDADPGGPGHGPPGHPGAARGRGAAARPAGLAGRPVPGGWRHGDQPDRHRPAAAAVRAGHLTSPTGRRRKG